MANVINKLKDFFTETDQELETDENVEYEQESGDNHYHEVYDDEEDRYEGEVVHEEAFHQNKRKNNELKNKGKVVSMHSGNIMKVVISVPRKYDDCQEIADSLKQGKSVIVNLESLNSDPAFSKIIDFISGAIYVLDGKMKQISKYILFLAPSNVDVDERIKHELESKVVFPWQKDNGGE